MASAARIRSNYAVVLAALVVAVAAIFIADTVTDYAVAVAIFHTAVMLVATRFVGVRAVAALATACVVLTCLSFVLTPAGDYKIGLINTGISVVAIGVTAYLGLKLKGAEAQVHEARERITRIARLTTLGQLTASIAHEVSQPLAAIATSAGAGRRWLVQPEPRTEKALAAVDRIIREADRASEILDRVRRLARNEAPASSVFDLNAAVTEIIALSSSAAGASGAMIDADLAEGLPSAFADRVQVQQVVSNLLLNGMEAPAVSKRLRRLAVMTRAVGDRLRVAVADDGEGLSAEAAEHLYDAFWTTKAGGFGLGLTICRAIVEANGGRIWTEASPLGGACFVFDLPVAGDDT
ncbi:Sensor histidine kinase TmoS [Brevundimonas sp. SH203]|uniref:sensor histidine kinase n=1 Tax=Brevundimonas sp. SH203 TaxID=345167 RepID=UPI0009D119D6|nr:ATP-binding protein [Brevundimonas sp. SH203]GAW41167.1 Sensor histidine kinase TmoS [Brevundimonas sp. SH203]